MGLNHLVSALSILLLVVGVTSQGTVFDVTQLGAQAGGKTDTFPALTKAFEQACSCTEASQIVVPEGIFGLREIKFTGPCKAPIEFKIQGTLQAPGDPKAFKTQSWVTFEKIDNIVVSGGGTFDGQGPVAWASNQCAQNKNCPKLPLGIRFDFVNNGMISDIKSLNSKNFHMNINACKNLTFTRITIEAPAESPNTDGIHMGRCSNITITDSVIATGDDCISIGEGSEQIDISGVTCGPGHGISVGSLGRYPKEAPVLGIRVTNCTFINTDYGARIKTWPKNPEPGVADEMHYSDLKMQNVTFPILIDQGYCPNGNCADESSSTIQLSKISFKDIVGTVFSTIAVKLDCSKSNPCKEVEIGNIDLQHEGTFGGAGPARFMCSNVTPTLSGTQNPAACSSPDAPLVEKSR